VKTDGRWVKLYVDESTSFMKLSATTRAYAAYFLKLGAQHGGRLPSLDVLLGFIGANKRDREIISRVAIPHLVADGYLVQDGDGFIIRNFDVAQGHRAVSARPSRSERAAVAQESRSGRAAVAQSDLTAGKHSNDPPVEERRGEEKRGESEAPKPVTSETGTVHWILRRFDLQWCEVYNRQFRTSRGTGERAEISKWLLENEELPLQRIWADFDAIVGRYLANKKESLVKNQHPLVWLLQDLQAYDKPSAARKKESSNDIAALEALR